MAKKPKYKLMKTEGVRYYLIENQGKSIAIAETENDLYELCKLIYDKKLPTMNVTIEVVPHTDDIGLSPNFQKDLRAKGVNIEGIIRAVTEGHLKRWAHKKGRRGGKIGSYEEIYTDHHIVNVTPEGEIDEGEEVDGGIGSITRYRRSSKEVSVPISRSQINDRWAETLWSNYRTVLPNNQILSLQRAYRKRSDELDEIVLYSAKVYMDKRLLMNYNHKIFRELYRTINRRFGFLTDLDSLEIPTCISGWHRGGLC